MKARKWNRKMIQTAVCSPWDNSHTISFTVENIGLINISTSEWNIPSKHMQCLHFVYRNCWIHRQHKVAEKKKQAFVATAHLMDIIMGPRSKCKKAEHLSICNVLLYHHSWPVCDLPALAKCVFYSMRPGCIWSTNEPVRQQYLHSHGEQLVHDVFLTPPLLKPEEAALPSDWLMWP